MIRLFCSLLLLAFASTLSAQTPHSVVVADSATRVPLPNVSIYNRHGKAIGMTSDAGRLPAFPPISYPLTLRYLGFNDLRVPTPPTDTLFLTENIAALPEVVINSRHHSMLHMLAYVREYSTLSTFTDTVMLFREKMVDFMLPTDSDMKYRGWSRPRVLTVKSYYRFTNASGLDSVSDVSQHHFSWSDWIGTPPPTSLPPKLRHTDIATDTLRGKYSPAETWLKEGDRVTVALNILADSTTRRWTPHLAGFLRKDIDFERITAIFRYTDIVADTLSPIDLASYTFTVESTGRGHDMFQFHRRDEPFFISTQAEVYILDKEYITVKEAKKWEERRFDIAEVGIYEPLDAPPLSPETLALIDRVNAIDKDAVRLAFQPDPMMFNPNSLRLRSDSRSNFRIARRALLLLKQVTGISTLKSNRNINRNWDTFKRSRSLPTTPLRE